MHWMLSAVVVLGFLGSCVAQSRGRNGLCGTVGKLIACQCMEEGCEDGLFPVGVCPMLPMIPMLPRMQCCPLPYVMLCLQSQRGRPYQTQGRNSRSLGYVPIPL
ncbi:uncharacterized protein LOC130054268 [Ostrea edulis]|uniref:uncharacterized protein LOC130054268 n=1 Tax=Ostrea edulis TaxID=37623 RepID=UPI0024AF2117|nr:uncharacterized protein LOC130054268 [Ostrea edulis]